MDTAGVLYFVVGERGRKEYLERAILSARSLKRYMLQFKTCLFTDLGLKVTDIVCFDEVIQTEKCKSGKMWEYKWEECLMKSPYNPTLHLDADTYICSNFSEVFDLLDRFDLVMPLSPHYGLKEWHGVPSCFPELAGGFMLWKKNEKVEWFFNRTLELIKMKLTKRGDEPYLTKALYESDVRYAIVPWEYTCVFTHPGYLYGPVKIMHGRRTNDIKKDAKIFNQSVGKRIFTGEELIEIDVGRKKCRVKQITPYRRKV